jgi:hypothetical protein
MLSEVCLWSAVALFLLLAIVDAGYLYRGRHRGLYVEQREWLPQPDPYFTREASITLPKGFDPQTAVITLTPPGGLESFPLIGLPTYTQISEDSNGRAGEWGDSAFDIADSADLCVTASLWLPGDPEEWFDIGLMDENGIITSRD